MSDDIDLTGYFERIGFSGSIAPNLETLSALVELHAAAIPFENLTPMMREPVRIERLNIQQKLIYEKRGGYCLEQNLLLHWALETLGYEGMEIYAANVLLGNVAREGPPTHILISVPIGANTYIADVGLGGVTVTAPLRLRGGVEQETPHETYRLTGGDPDWLLEAKVGEEWRHVTVFNTAAVDADALIEMNDRVSVDFRDFLLAGRAVKGKRHTLRNLTAKTYTIGGDTETILLRSVQELKETLSGTFGIALPPADKLDPVLQTLVDRELPLLGAA